jgi:hypothetical protein
MNNTVSNIMKSIRSGETFTKGFLAISHFDQNRDTFMVDSLYNGISKREELTASTVRKIVRDNI